MLAPGHNVVSLIFARYAHSEYVHERSQASLATCGKQARVCGPSLHMYVTADIATASGIICCTSSPVVLHAHLGHRIPSQSST